MQTDQIKTFFTYVIALAVLAGCFYGLVLYSYELAPLIQGALISAASTVLAFVFGDQIASRTAKAAEAASAAGAQQATIPYPASTDTPTG